MAIASVDDFAAVGGVVAAELLYALARALLPTAWTLSSLSLDHIHLYRYTIHNFHRPVGHRAACEIDAACQLYFLSIIRSAIDLTVLFYLAFTTP